MFYDFHLNTLIKDFKDNCFSSVRFYKCIGLKAEKLSPETKMLLYF